MKKLILVLAIALMACPAWAVLTVDLVEVDSDTVAVHYSGADTANLPRAFALKLTIDGTGEFTAVTATKTGESTASAPGFGIFPARIQISTAGAVTDYGNPLAAADSVGTTDQVLPSKEIVLEFGSLYYGDANAPATEGTLCTIDFTKGSATAIAMEDELTYRGGLVFEDGTQGDVAFNYPIQTEETITPPTVNKTTAAPAVADKVNGGRSETFVASATSSLGHTLEYQFTWGDGVVGSWGAASQTHTYTYSATGNYTVTVQARCAADTAVVSAVSANYVVTREAVKSSNATIYAAWADFGRPNCWAFQRNCRGDADGAGSGLNANKVWVNATDLNKLALYYGKNVAGCPVCTDTTNIWFWTN